MVGHDDDDDDDDGHLPAEDPAPSWPFSGQKIPIVTLEEYFCLHWHCMHVSHGTPAHGAPTAVFCVTKCT